METTRPHRNLIDVSAVADRLGASVRYVRRLVAERRIPFYKFGHLLRFDSDEVEAWLDRTRVGEIGPRAERSFNR